MIFLKNLEFQWQYYFKRARVQNKTDSDLLPTLQVFYTVSCLSVLSINFPKVSVAEMKVTKCDTGVKVTNMVNYNQSTSIY